MEAAALLGLRVLVVEDQPEAAEMVRGILQRAGMRSVWAATGHEALASIAGFDPAIVLVDLELPDTNGLPLIQWLVANTGCGIIVVSGHADEAERVTCLESGADDYITKPATPRELVARIRAVQRRIEGSAKAGRPVVPSPGLPLGPLVVDLKRRQVRAADGSEIHLTGAEFAVLRALLEAAEQPVSRKVLSPLALRRPWQAEDRGIDQLVFELRRKLVAHGADRRVITTVRHCGYQILLP